MIGAMTFSSVRSFLVQASRVAVRIEHRAEQARLSKQRRQQAQQQRRPQQAGPVSTQAAAGTSTVGSSSTVGSAAERPTTIPHSATSAAALPALADLVGCAAAQLLGFYLISSVLLMRASLPHEFRQGISEAVEIGGATLEFDFYHHFFDALFLAAASATLAALLVQRAARRSARSIYSFGARAASVRQMEGERRHHYAVRASAQRQRADGSERSAALAAQTRSPIISPPASRFIAGGPTSVAFGGGRSPVARRTRPSSEPAALNLAAAPAEAQAQAEAESLTASVLAGECDDSPTNGAAVQGGKAAQDAVAALAAEAAAAAAYGPQALVDYAAAKLSALESEEVDGSDEDAKEN